MKKVLFGVVFGFVLSLAVPVLASNMMGRAVDSEYPVYVNGTLSPKTAIAIDGVSYLPTRYIAETAGFNVGFKDKQIILNNGETVQTQTSGDVGKIQYYKIRSSDIEISTEPIPYEAYLVRDGNLYLPIAVFGSGNYFRWEPGSQTVSFSVYGNSVSFMGSEVYSTGCPGYKDRGLTYVNIGSIGLKHEIKGDEIWLEKI